jgi:hypothetical protein
MRNVGSMVVVVMIGAAWIGLAAGTLTHLAQMGGTLEARRAADTARQTAHTAPLVALAAPRNSAQ